VEGLGAAGGYVVVEVDSGEPDVAAEADHGDAAFVYEPTHEAGADVEVLGGLVDGQQAPVRRRCVGSGAQWRCSAGGGASGGG
jgi:hypothetical protein